MEVKRRKDRSRSVIRIEKDKYAIFQRDWALFIWNENKRAKRANNFILLFRSRIILQLTVKILLQLLIEPPYHRKTRYIKRNNRSIAFVESRFLFDRHSALNFLYIGGSFINNCDRLNKQKKKKKQSLQIRFHWKKFPENENNEFQLDSFNSVHFWFGKRKFNDRLWTGLSDRVHFIASTEEHTENRPCMST